MGRLWARARNFWHLITRSGVGSAFLFALTSRELRIKHPYRRQNLTIRGRSTDWVTFRQCFINQHYAASTLPKTAKVIIDLGANVGFSAVFFRNLYPDALIVCVEPERHNYEILRKNTKSDQQCLLMHGAISTTDGYMRVSNPHAVQNSYRYEQTTETDERRIAAIKMSSLLQRVQITGIDILKVDIEGYEWELFSGDIGWLDVVKLVLCETHEDLRPGVTSVLRDAGERYGFKVERSGEGLMMSK